MMPCQCVLCKHPQSWTWRRKHKSSLSYVFKFSSARNRPMECIVINETIDFNIVMLEFNISLNFITVFKPNVYILNTKRRS